MEEKRYCTVQESLTESCKEVKLIRKGKFPEKTWEEFVPTLRKWAEEVKRECDTL